MKDPASKYKLGPCKTAYLVKDPVYGSTQVKPDHPSLIPGTNTVERQPTPTSCPFTSTTAGLIPSALRSFVLLFLRGLWNLFLDYHSN